MYHSPIWKSEAGSCHGPPTPPLLLLPLIETLHCVCMRVFPGGLCAPLQAVSTLFVFIFSSLICSTVGGRLCSYGVSLLPWTCTSVAGSAWIFDIWVLNSSPYPQLFNRDLQRASVVQSTDPGTGGQKANKTESSPALREWHCRVGGRHQSTEHMQW